MFTELENLKIVYDIKLEMVDEGGDPPGSTYCNLSWILRRSLEWAIIWIIALMKGIKEWASCDGFRGICEDCPWTWSGCCCVGKPTFRIEGDNVSEGGFEEGLTKSRKTCDDAAVEAEAIAGTTDVLEDKCHGWAWACTLWVKILSWKKDGDDKPCFSTVPTLFRGLLWYTLA